MHKGFHVRRSILELVDYYLNGGPYLSKVYYRQIVLLGTEKSNRTFFGTFYRRIGERPLGRMAFRPNGIQLDENSRYHAMDVFCSAIFTFPAPEYRERATRVTDIKEDAFCKVIDYQLSLLEDYYERV